MFARSEQRFAARKAQLCHGCGRTIDEEDYTRTVVSQAGTMISWADCRDCRPIR